MNLNGPSKIPQILKDQEAQLLAEWLKEQMASGTRRNLFKESQLQEECKEFLDLFAEAVQKGNLINIETSEWRGVRDMLATISRARSQKGLTPSETASFIFSFKQPLFNKLTQELGNNTEALLAEIWLLVTS